MQLKFFGDQCLSVFVNHRCSNENGYEKIFLVVSK